MAGPGRDPDQLLSAMEFINPHRPGRTTWSYRVIPASDPRPHPIGHPALPLDVEIVAQGTAMDLSEFHHATFSTSLSVLADGALVHEWYGDRCGPRDLFLGASATKSVLAHLVGVAVRSGALDLATTVGDHLPELRASGYARVPVRALLTMTSGMDWVEDHRDPTGAATALVRTFTAGGSSRALLAGIGARWPPGTRYEYCTADSQVLDWVRERATGAPFRRALADLWRAMGCTEDATVVVDGDGVALAGGGLAAVAADWARVGMLQVDGVLPGGVRLLDPEWVEHASRPSLPFLRPGRLPSALSAHVGFGYHWWPLDDAGTRVSADGSRGQFVYVDRPRRVVVVKTSAWPYSDPAQDRRCRDLSYLALPAIVAATARPATHGGVPR